jgi:hypothetical protein
MPKLWVVIPLHLRRFRIDPLVDSERKSCGDVRGSLPHLVKVVYGKGQGANMDEPRYRCPTYGWVGTPADLTGRDGEEVPTRGEAVCPFCHARNRVPTAGEVLGEATWVPRTSDDERL